MAKNQGVIRLKNGILRKVTISEARRGYFYITTDRVLDLMLKDPGIETIVNRASVGRKSTDSYGRIRLGKELLGNLTSSMASIKLIGKKLFIDFK